MSGAVYLLLADVSHLQSLGRKFRRGGSTLQLSDLLFWLVVLLLVVAAASLIAQRIARRQQPGYRSPRRLFLELCRVHGLDRHRRRLLRQLAAVQRLEQPARLFLEPKRFDPANLGPALSQRSDELARIRDTLFAKRLKAG